MLRHALQAQDFAPVPDADEVVILNFAVALVCDNFHQSLFFNSQRLLMYHRKTLNNGRTSELSQMLFQVE